MYVYTKSFKITFENLKLENILKLKMKIILDSTTHIFHQDETTHIASFHTDPSYSYAKVQKFLWQNEMFLKLAYTPAS